MTAPTIATTLLDFSLWKSTHQTGSFQFDRFAGKCEAAFLRHTNRRATFVAREPHYNRCSRSVKLSALPPRRPRRRDSPSASRRLRPLARQRPRLAGCCSSCPLLTNDRRIYLPVQRRRHLRHRRPVRGGHRGPHRARYPAYVDTSGWRHHVTLLFSPRRHKDTKFRYFKILCALRVLVPLW